MQIRATSEIFVRDRPEGEYIHPGMELSLPDDRAQRLIDLGHAEAVDTTKPAKAAAKAEGA